MVTLWSISVGVLGTGVPRLACLRPTACLSQQAVRPIFTNKASKTLARRTTQDLLWSSLGSQDHEERRYQGGQTSRGPCDVSHDARRQAGAGSHSVFISSLVLRRPAQAKSIEASGKGCYIGATRPRPGGRQDGGHCGAQDGVTTRPFRRR